MRITKTNPLSKRILSGLTSGFLIGILLGAGIASWVIISRDPHQPALLKAYLRLHMAVIYGLILLIPGFLIGILALKKRKNVELLARALIFLSTLLAFYYGRNITSFYVLERVTEHRWIYEIVATIVWIAVCWIMFRFLMFLEQRVRGLIVTVTTLMVIFVIAWNVYPMITTSNDHIPMVVDLDLPAPKEDVKVALIGIDAAWWEIITPMLEKGELPNFSQLIDRGVHAPFETLIPTASPALWTTIITGKLPEKHRITHFRVSQFPITGVVVPFNSAPQICYEFNWMLGPIIKQIRMNSTFRMTEALWNILSDAGLTVGVLNWWSSYPAEPVNGYNVSIQAYDFLVRASRNEPKQGEAVSVYPPELFPKLVPLVIDPLKFPLDSLARFIHILSPEDFKLYQNIPRIPSSTKGQEMGMLKFNYPWDESVVRMTKYLTTTHEQPDFLAVFLDGLDPIQHWYLPYYFHERHRAVLTQANIDRLKDTVPEYYRYLDEVLARLLNSLDPNTIIIIVSDHGFDHGLHRNMIYEHNNAPPGVFIAAGKNIEPGTPIEHVSVKDITPTILSAFGLPIGRDMDGRAVTEIFEQDVTSLQWIDTYDIKPRVMGKPMTTELDEDHNERLRALGYVK